MMVKPSLSRVSFHHWLGQQLYYTLFTTRNTGSALDPEPQWLRPFMMTTPYRNISDVCSHRQRRGCFTDATGSSESGDLIERTMPGGLQVIEDMDDAERQEYVEFWSATLDSWLQVGCTKIIIGAATHVQRQIAQSLFSKSETCSPNREFAERFKYIVISSSLLSSNLPTASTTTVPDSHPPSARFPPGDWNHDKHSHEIPAELPGSTTMSWLVPMLAAGAAASFSTLISAILFILAIIKYGTDSSANLTPSSPLNHVCYSRSPYIDHVFTLLTIIAVTLGT